MPGTVFDSGAKVNILEGALGSSTRIQLTCITGPTTEAETVDAVFPVLAADGSRHAISICGKNIVATRATDIFLSLVVLLNEGYNVNFRVGTDLDRVHLTRAFHAVYAERRFRQALSKNL